MKVALDVHNLTVSYDQSPVLWDVDFEIPEGKITGVIGPNGSGKTTLIKTIMGILKPDSGHVRIFGQKLKQVRKKVAYVPQKESVDWDFPTTVKDVVKMGRYRPGGVFRRLTSTDKKIVADAIDQVGLTQFQNRQIAQLSGGQQQRVFLARALAQKADIYFMDEPFVGVDAATENAILAILQKMIAGGKTIVIIHHDLHTVAKYFDYILLLNTRLVACGPKAEVLTKENLENAYGGQLTALSYLGNVIKEKEFPIREKGFKEHD